MINELTKLLQAAKKEERERTIKHLKARLAVYMTPDEYRRIAKRVINELTGGE